MSQNERKFKHKQTPVQKQFSDFVEHITNLFVGSDFSKSYMTPEDIKNRWRYECAYKPEAVDFLILQSKTYLHMLSKESPNARNPQFLETLVKLMADYLSAYTMRGGSTRKNAKVVLEKVLFSENPYIQLLIAEQKQKNQTRRTPHAVETRRKQEAKEQARRTRLIHNQVMAEFAAVSEYRKKR